MKMRWKREFIEILCLLFGNLLLCEFLIYYFVLNQCEWPTLKNEHEIDQTNPKMQPIKAMVLTDTHLLGPHNGHWLDKLRREWQMHRSFQTTMTLFRPEVVFFLGDILDEGYFVNNKYFNEYVLRFHKIFHVPKTTRVITLAGNHDVGFHYRMHPYYTDRFEENFNNSGKVSLYTIRNVHFVALNSMAMEDDNCYFCEIAKEELANISETLNCYKFPETCQKKLKHKLPYSKPILMQHFPTYRISDAVCIEGDSPKIETFRDKWEVISKEATQLLGDSLSPRLAFSGHIHHYCRTKNLLNIEEYSVASFSWRNKNQPSFVLAKFTPDDYAISICYIPKESTVLLIYAITILICFAIILSKFVKKMKTK